jgi:hypothetical protein
MQWQAGASCAQTPVLDWLAQGAQQAADPNSFIDTDGPTFTRASTTVPTGIIQLETRYSYSWRPNVNSFPQLDLRIGLTPRIELRAEWVGVDFGPNFRSSEDLEVGFKFEMTKQSGWIPQSALATELLTPTGYGQNAFGTVAPEVDYIYNWSLTQKFGFGGSTGAIFGQPGAANVTQFYQSAVLSRSWLEQRVLTECEWYSLFGSGTNQGAVLPSIDGAILLRLTHNLQLDWRAGFGLNRQATSFFTNGGLSVRY